jgi:hypothetical protein
MRVLRFWGAPLAVLVCICLAFASCGGDDGASTAAESDGLSSPPAQLITSVLRTASTAKKRKDCKELTKVNLRSATKVVCPPLTPEMRKANKSTKLVSAATYGPAAVIDYTSPGAKKGASIILYRNAEGEWAIANWGLLYGSTVGSDADDREDSEAIVTDYLAAVRERDCEGYNKVALTQSSELKDVCKQEFPGTELLAKALKGNPDVEPRYIGGNEDFNFWSLQFEGPEPRAYTIGTAATPEGSLRPQVVLTAHPAPVAGS